MKLRYHHIRWLVAVAALLVLPAMAQVRDTIDFDISDRTFEAITVDGETFNLYSYPDCDHIDQTGAPMLPVKYIRLSVPYNATDITVTASGDWTSGSATRRIYPAPIPIPTDGSVTEDPEMVIDSTTESEAASSLWACVSLVQLLPHFTTKGAAKNSRNAPSHSPEGRKF